MAGDRQHVLPRFLLKGFASRVERKGTYTWVYSKEREPFETNIINIGVEKYFYGGDGELNVDDDITDFEGEYAPLLDELREHKGQVDISDPRIANLITHFVVRTKHIRDSYRESIEYLAELMRQYFSDHNNIKKAILSNPEMINDNIESKFKDNPELLPYKHIILPLLPKLLFDYLDHNKDQIYKSCQDYFDMIKKVAPKAMKEGHIKGLTQSLTPEPRVEDYKSLRWFVYNSKELLILGDIGCLIEVEGERRFKSLNVEDDVVKNIFLPISETQLIIGTSHSTFPPVDIDYLNEMMARCSREFFISSENSLTKQALVDLLGSEPGIYSKEEIERIAKNIFKRFSINHN
jgi:uncharacterized protein with HEPN domain